MASSKGDILMQPLQHSLYKCVKASSDAVATDSRRGGFQARLGRHAVDKATVSNGSQHQLRLIARGVFPGERSAYCNVPHRRFLYPLWPSLWMLSQAHDRFALVHAGWSCLKSIFEMNFLLNPAAYDGQDLYHISDQPGKRRFRVAVQQLAMAP